MSTDFKPRIAMTKREAFQEFRDLVLSCLPKGDVPCRDQAWVDYTDRLCKEGRISQRQCDTWVHPFNR